MHEFEPDKVSLTEIDVHIKRVYDKAARAPSTALRKWFGHHPKRWQKFRERYRAELQGQTSELCALRQRAAQQRVTLLYAARDARFNHAVALEEVIRGV